MCTAPHGMFCFPSWYSVMRNIQTFLRANERFATLRQIPRHAIFHFEFFLPISLPPLFLLLFSPFFLLFLLLIPSFFFLVTPLSLPLFIPLFSFSSSYSFFFVWYFNPSPSGTLYFRIPFVNLSPSKKGCTYSCIVFWNFYLVLLYTTNYVQHPENPFRK